MTLLHLLVVSLLLQSVPLPPAAPLWSITDGMDSPESVYFDGDSGFLFVSQIGGQAAARDGNGRISKLTVDGKLLVPAAFSWFRTSD